MSSSRDSPRDLPPPPPPAPFDDFSLFDPAFFPSPPPLPASADLFSVSETTDFFGFLENFNWDFEIDPQLQGASYQGPPPEAPLLPPPPPPPPHVDPSLLPNGVGQPPSQQPPPEERPPTHSNAASASPSSVSASARSTSPPPEPGKQKALLSTPQKRLNHIMSEQKRRNAIRDGYLQLTTLLAPAGAPIGSGMPTRGRPKGSGGRGRGSKGKSGILFKAKEYIRFLEEGRDALADEVEKLEAAAGIRRA